MRGISSGAGPTVVTESRQFDSRGHSRLDSVLILVVQSVEQSWWVAVAAVGVVSAFAGAYGTRTERGGGRWA